MDKEQVKKELDTLSMYHHVTFDFDTKLKDLLSILDEPKEHKLAERFKKIESILDPMFRVELIQRLCLLKTNILQSVGANEEGSTHLQMLLHLECLLSCTNSLGYIAEYLELTIEEVQELIRELHNTFSIDSLISRVRQYFEENKKMKNAYVWQKNKELLGIETTAEPKDTAEVRKTQLRKRYGHLSSFVNT